MVVEEEGRMTKFDITMSRPAIGVYITIVVWLVLMIIWLILYAKIK